MSLSKENYDKLNENYLYKREPVRSSKNSWSGSDIYHCKNWTFKVDKVKDGRAFMLDTYYNNHDSHCIQVTDENINDFEVVFDFREVKRIGDYDIDEYDDEDLIYAATNSGGYSCGHLHWVKNNVEKSKQLIIDKKKRKIESLRQSLEWAEDDLKRLME